MSTAEYVPTIENAAYRIICCMALVVALGDGFDFEDAADEAYNTLERNGWTVREATRIVELAKDKMHKVEELLNHLRNDMSTRMGDPEETFDRDRHTHQMGNVPKELLGG